MKKTAAIILAAACLLGLAGCGKAAGDGEKITGGADFSNTESNDAVETQQTPQTAAGNEIGLAMTTKDETSTGLTVVFTQSGGSPTGDLQTGSDYSIEKYENDSWIPVKTIIPLEEVGWDCIAYIIEKEDTTEMEVDWSFLYGELETGVYRIQKSVMDFRDTGEYDTVTLQAEFAIVD